jgi:hypothetical protein
MHFLSIKDLISKEIIIFNILKVNNFDEQRWSRFYSLVKANFGMHSYYEGGIRLL